ncbi:MAG: exodeoxyribonuclease VII large subunit [Cellulosilyticaceae bacterium]
MKRKAVSVGELNRYVARLLEEDYMLNNIWLVGEVSNCKYHHTGHIYFSIKDGSASINSVMFASDAKKLTCALKEGVKIYAKARISLYEKTGNYQAYISEIETVGAGDLYEKFEQLKQKLLADGLFDPMYKKAVPTYPKKVGVITSSTGAAIQDILQIAARRNPSIPVYIYPSHVQGEYAAAEIVTAIQKANDDGIVDVIILGRGGGSIEDLWVFNEEVVAKAIFASDIPIVSAVGHEVDFTISDFVSDLRAATPSAAAEIVFPEKKDYLNRLKRYQDSLSYAMGQQLRTESTRIEALLTRPIFKNKAKYFNDRMVEVTDLGDDLAKAYEKRVEKAIAIFQTKLSALETLSPMNTLKRGYSLVTKENGELLKSSKRVEIEEKVHITMNDGTIIAKVEKKG